ncbi:MAG: TetR/AcrR family transcriptional regulator [Rhodomicrobium sp.]|nr:TetR/AcrR family transcriptional regulator [Rhodomicrobium sp.]
MRADTMARLIASARQSFAEKGYGETSMDTLCAEAGLTRGALYHHFGSKEGLFEAVLTQIDEEIGARLEAIWESESDPWRAFLACCRGYVALAIEPEIQQIALKDAPAVLGQRFRELDAASSIAPLRAALEQLMDAEIIGKTDAEALAVSINGAMMDLGIWVARSSDPTETLGRAHKALIAILTGLLQKKR